ncbi:hypothetical protein Tco_0427576 [Tanacetum coccineum]
MKKMMTTASFLQAITGAEQERATRRRGVYEGAISSADECAGLMSVCGWRYRALELYAVVLDTVSHYLRAISLPMTATETSFERRHIPDRARLYSLDSIDTPREFRTAHGAQHKEYLLSFAIRIETAPFRATRHTDEHRDPFVVLRLLRGVVSIYVLRKATSLQSGAVSEGSVRGLYEVLLSPPRISSLSIFACHEVGGVLTHRSYPGREAALNTLSSGGVTKWTAPRTPANKETCGQRWRAMRLYLFVWSDSMFSSLWKDSTALKLSRKTSNAILTSVTLPGLCIMKTLSQSDKYTTLLSGCLGYTISYNVAMDAYGVSRHLKRIVGEAYRGIIAHIFTLVFYEGGLRIRRVEDVLHGENKGHGELLKIRDDSIHRSDKGDDVTRGEVV